MLETKLFFCNNRESSTEKTFSIDFFCKKHQHVCAMQKFFSSQHPHAFSKMTKEIMKYVRVDACNFIENLHAI